MRKSISFFCIGIISCSLAQAQITKPKRNFVESLVTMSHPNYHYKVGDQAEMTIHAQTGGEPVNDVWVVYQHGPEMLYDEKYDSVAFHDGKAVIPIGTMTEPGFLACKYRFKVAGKNFQDLVKVGFEPERISSYAQAPKNFIEFWNKGLKSIETIPFDAKLTRMEKYDSEKSAVWLVEITVGKNGRKMYGYLSKPKDGQKHPVLFYPPGAGTKKIVAENIYSDQGYICLKIEIHGFNPELSDKDYAEVKKKADNYNGQNILDKEKFYYHDVYLGCSRCVDYLCSLPDWDGKNVLVTGGSQGGALTVVTSALNKKVTALACFYPALNDLTAFLHHRAGGWPKYFSGEDYSKPISKENQDKVAAVLQYYDVTNFARILTQPGFYNFGYADNTCSPTSVWGMVNAITAPKKVVVTPTSAHWRFLEVNDESLEWMKSQMK